LAIQIKFVKKQKGEGSRMIGTLEWGDYEYKIVTGGYGKGQIPDGMYEIKVRNSVVGNSNTMQSGFVNPLTGRGWFIPLTPKFSTSRDGFGIHPDGNLPGTKGCLGLQGEDTKEFWDRWMKTPLNTRPTTLLVITKLEKS
jgi:hypothetical protein